MKPTPERCPYYHLVPKEFYANLRFREHVIRLGYDDPEMARELWIMCSRDILFYVNTFCFIYEPRDHREIPWITYKFQDDTLLDLCNAIETGIDVTILKSRDMGASWMCMAAVQWNWQFHDMYRFGGISEKDELVDMPNEPKSIFYKFDKLLAHQPKWLKPVNEIERTRNHARNRDNGSTFNGQSTTSTSGTADRCTAMILDEFSKVGSGRSEVGFDILTSTRDVTRCRIFNFTPNGTGNAAYAVAQNENIRQIRLNWTLHPEKSKGLYTSANGKLRILDKDFRGMVRRPVRGRVVQTLFPDRYPFVLDGRVRSPAYDFEEARANDSQQMAQEWDMDFLGSSRHYFDFNHLDMLMTQVMRPSVLLGDLMYDRDTFEPLRYEERRTGTLRLWVHLDVAGKPPRSEYAIGADIAMGTGASNSALSIVDLFTGEKVAEYANPFIPPQTFAKLSIAVCKWFCTEDSQPAMLIWEGTGPGNVYTDTILSSSFRNIFYRTDEQRIGRHVSDRPGWYPSRDAKATLFMHYRHALQSMRFLNRSKWALDECRQYVYNQSGDPVHGATGSERDPSGAGSNHGDRVIADALACKLLLDRDVVRKKEEPEIPVYCYHTRRKRWEREKREKESWLATA